MMSDYFEFYVRLHCPKCGSRQDEAVEFELQNRTTDISAEKRAVDCEKCENKITFKPKLFIEVYCE